jgi:nucleoside phosphorylase
MGKVAAHEYNVGWICALDIELTAAIAMMDEHHENLPRARGDDNIYVLGRLSGHNVVVATLPLGMIGTNSAAQVATDMLRTFPAIKVGLVVGIGGGVPRLPTHDIRLGDVVVSRPRNENGGVIQYDFGRNKPDEFIHLGSLFPPPRLLLSALNTLKGWHHFPTESKLATYLSPISNPKLPIEFAYPESELDLLFKPKYFHVSDETCVGCDRANIIYREPRTSHHPCVHYGTIASGNQVIMDGVVRDQLAMEYDILCFEMEAAGLMNIFPCVVIRGISDYSDSHKNDRWKRYAAATAAAFGKELLRFIPVEEINTQPDMALTFESLHSPRQGYPSEEVLSQPKELEAQDGHFSPAHSSPHKSNSYTSLPSAGSGGSSNPVFSVLVHESLSWNEVALGRLVLNLDDPGQDFYIPPDVEILPEEIAVRPFRDIEHILEKRSKSHFAKGFIKTFLSKGSQTLDRAPGPTYNRLVTYKLLNSGMYLERMIKEETVRRWLEKVFWRGAVFLTVGIHAIIENSVLASAENSDTNSLAPSLPSQSAGTRIIGAQYRKLRVERFDRNIFNSVYLENRSFWKEYDRGNRAESPYFYVVEFDENISFGDLHDHYTFEDYRSDETGENYLLMVCIFLLRDSNA